MPEIRIDNLGISTPDDPDASLSGYLLRTLRLVATSPGEFAKLLDKPIRDVELTGARGGFTVEQSTGVGNPHAAEGEWSILAGANAEVGIWSQPGDVVLGATKFGPKTELTVPAQGAYVSFGVRGRVGGGPSVPLGGLTFGLSAGASIEATYYHPLAGSTPVREAVTAALRKFVLPGDLPDLAKLAPKAAAGVKGSGQLRFNLSGSLALSANPIAVNIPVVNRPLGIQPGASIGFRASATFTGEYEIRAVGLGAGKVSLGLYRAAGSAFDLAVTAQAGPGLSGIPEAVLGAVTGRADVDRAFLRNAGLSESRIDDLRATIRAAVDRRLAASLELAFGGATSTGPALLFTIELAALDSASRHAVRDALDGDFRAITTLPADGETLAGVKLERSLVHEAMKRTGRLRLNLFGIFNYESLFELVRTGREVYDPASGELVFLDEVTAKRRESWLDNTKQIATERLARLMADTVLISLSTTAAATAGTQPAIRMEHWYFEYQRRAKAADMKDHCDAAAALGLAVAQPPDAPRFERLTLLAESSYDDAAARAVFLSPAGEARPREFYVSAGRRALASLESGDEADPARALLGSNDKLYAALSVAGSRPNALAQLAKLKPGGHAIPVTVQEAMYTDYLAIEWWADAMHSLSAVLAQLQASGGGGARGLRKELQSRLAEVVSRTKPMFGEPWGLVAMYLASAGKAGAHVRITAEGFEFERSRGWS